MARDALVAPRSSRGPHPRVLGVLRFVVDHWLFAFNVGMGVFATLPILAPVLLAAGADRAANVLYVLYGLTCHQLPGRAWHILGHPMPYCHRNTAIYFAMVLAGLAFARWRTSRPLDLRLYGLLILPMAIDGFTQLFGWRESTWQLRTVTGALFGASTIWLIYPLLDRNMADVRAEMAAFSRRPSAHQENRDDYTGVHQPARH